VDNLRNKTLSFIIALLFIFTLAACGGENDNNDETPPTLNTDLTDNLQLEVNYEDKTFIDDGIEEVTLVSCEDGDTAEFRTHNEILRVRFLGVDTPEASHYYEPWGVPATNFTCERLDNAETLVLEWEETQGKFDNYNRALAYIWYDGRLLNLELAEQAYSSASGVGNYKYGELLQEANNHASQTNLRIWGEDDPEFPYVDEGEALSIEELVKNPEPHLLSRVTVSGVITRIYGDQAYLQDGDYGIFIYAGHGRSNPDRLAVGNHVTIEDAQVYEDVRRYGGIFLTDVNAQNNPSKTGTIQVNEQGLVTEPTLLTFEDFTKERSGTLIALNDLTITGFDTVMSSRENNHSTEIIYAKDSNDNTIVIEQSYRIYGPNRFDFSQLNEGDTINVVGPLRESLDGYIVLLTEASDLEIIAE